MLLFQSWIHSTVLRTRATLGRPFELTENPVACADDYLCNNEITVKLAEQKFGKRKQKKKIFSHLEYTHLLLQPNY